MRTIKLSFACRSLHYNTIISISILLFYTNFIQIFVYRNCQKERLKRTFLQNEKLWQKNLEMHRCRQVVKKASQNGNRGKLQRRSPEAKKSPWRKQWVGQLTELTGDLMDKNSIFILYSQRKLNIILWTVHLWRHSNTNFWLQGQFRGKHNEHSKIYRDCLDL